MENQMEKASTPGETVRYTQVSSRMDLSMEKASGGVEKVLNVTNTKEITGMTKSMGLEYFNGRVATATKESTETMRGTALEK